jgi:flagellar export protein FliJ
VKKFEFRLKKVEKLRQDKKRRKQRIFAEAERREASERSKLAKLSSEVIARRRQSRGSKLRKIDPDRLRSESDYINQLDFLVEHQEHRVAGAADNTSKCREKLKEASREVKKLERLEEIKRDQYIAETESFLQKENDEIASNIGRGSQPR